MLSVDIVSSIAILGFKESTIFQRRQRICGGRMKSDLSRKSASSIIARAVLTNAIDFRAIRLKLSRDSGLLHDCRPHVARADRFRELKNIKRDVPIILFSGSSSLDG